MAAGVAHDFGSFLGNIQAAAEVALLDLPQNAPARKELERIETVVEYARKNGQSVNGFSRRRRSHRRIGVH